MVSASRCPPLNSRQGNAHDNELSTQLTFSNRGTVVSLLCLVCWQTAAVVAGVAQPALMVTCSLLDISAGSDFQHAFHPLLLDLTRTHPFKLLFADHGVRRFHRIPFCPLSTKPVIAVVGLVVLAQERGLMKRALDSLSLPCVTYRRKREPSVHRLTGCHDGTGINEDNATRL